MHLSGLVIVLTVQLVVPACDGIYLPEFFRGWLNNDASDDDAAACDGVCQFALTYWFEGGRISPDGDCNNLFKVCTCSLNLIPFSI